MKIEQFKAGQRVRMLTSNGESSAGRNAQDFRQNQVFGTTTGNIRTRERTKRPKEGIHKGKTLTCKYHQAEVFWDFGRKDWRDLCRLIAVDEAEAA